MSDLLEERIREALRRQASFSTDTDAARVTFATRRQRRRRRLQALAGAAVVVAIVGGATAVVAHHQPKQTLTAGRGAQKVTDQPQPGPGGAAVDTTTPPGCANDAACPPSSTHAGGGSGTAVGSIVNAPPPHRSATTTSLPPPPTTLPAGQHTVTATDADSGKSYTLHRGDRLVVELSNANVWTEPQSSSQAVLARTSGSTNPDGSAEGSFVASADGQTTVTAQGRSHPLPCETATPPCMVPDHIVNFQINVMVVG